MSYHHNGHPGNNGAAGNSDTPKISKELGDYLVKELFDQLDAVQAPSTELAPLVVAVDETKQAVDRTNVLLLGMLVCFIIFTVRGCS